MATNPINKELLTTTASDAWVRAAELNRWAATYGRGT